MTLSPSQLCGCRDCRNPRPDTADRVLVHAERHRDFAARMATRPTNAEIGMWTAIRLLARHDADIPVRGTCDLPHHAMFPRHPMAH